VEQLSLEPDVSVVSTDTLNYQDWLSCWKSLTQHMSANIVLVSPEACRVTTPLKASAWSVYLQSHPHQELVLFFLSGITEHFKTGFNYHTQELKSAHKNLEGALSHPAYLQKEVHQ